MYKRKIYGYRKQSRLCTALFRCLVFSEIRWRNNNFNWTKVFVEWIHLRSLYFFTKWLWWCGGWWMVHVSVYFSVYALKFFFSSLIAALFYSPFYLCFSMIIHPRFLILTLAAWSEKKKECVWCVCAIMFWNCKRFYVLAFSSFSRYSWKWTNFFFVFFVLFPL